MAHMQHPTSIDISNEDYSIAVSCTQEYQFLRSDELSTPPSSPSVFAHEITLRFCVVTLLVSSSPNAVGVVYRSTIQDLTVLSNDLFSNRCAAAVEVCLGMVHIPFSLVDKTIDWCGKRTRPSLYTNRKLLRNVGELVSEIVGYIGKTREDRSLPLQKMVLRLDIKKLVVQPADVIASWATWSQHMWDEYYEFVCVKPMKDLRRVSLMNILEIQRQREGEFDSDEVCSICIEGLSENEIGGGGSAVAVTRLHCSHIYHESCISAWLVKSDYCPYCRAQIMLKITRR